MGRWEPDTPRRLQRASLELFGERGYEQTTVAEIAARAGLTERTFFRHFADKREVFFYGTEQFEQLFIDAVAEAPASATSAASALRAVEAAAEMLEGRRPISAARQQILEANPELAERELAKLHRVRRKLIGSLQARGGGEAEASLVAGAAMAVFSSSFERWVAGDPRPLPEIVREGMAELGELLSGAAEAPAPAKPAAAPA